MLSLALSRQAAAAAVRRVGSSSALSANRGASAALFSVKVPCKSHIDRTGPRPVQVIPQDGWKKLKRWEEFPQQPAQSAQQMSIATGGANSEYAAKMKKARPVSPNMFTELEGGYAGVTPMKFHFNFPLAAWSSVTIRITGAFMVVGMYGIGALALLPGDVVPAMMESIKSANDTVPVILPVAKFAVAFPLLYHSIGGMRHVLLESKPGMLDKEMIKNSAYVMFGSSLAISGIAMVV